MFPPLSARRLRLPAVFHRGGFFGLIGEFETQGTRDGYNDVQMGLVQQTTVCNALHNVEQRFYRWLLQARARCESNVIPLTREFLSEMLGVQRTSVTSIASALQAKGLIAYRRGRVEIIDRAALERKSCECHGKIAKREKTFFAMYHAEANTPNEQAAAT